ncbi:MAG: hypothetical protein ACRDYF_10875 [Acidimicrobiia bacterium]
MSDVPGSGGGRRHGLQRPLPGALVAAGPDRLDPSALGVERPGRQPERLALDFGAEALRSLLVGVMTAGGEPRSIAAATGLP